MYDGQKKFVVLWDLGKYFLIGYDDGEVGFASRDFLRRTPYQFWRSIKFKRAQGAANTRLFRAAIAGAVYARPALDEPPSNWAEVLDQFEIIEMQKVGFTTDASYQLSLGYGQRSGTWVVAEKPHTIDTVEVWSAGFTMARGTEDTSYKGGAVMDYVDDDADNYT